MKSFLLIVVPVILIVLITIFFMGNDIGTNINTKNKNIVLVGNVEIEIEIADTPAERSQGLSGRRSLAENEGMLFVFDSSQIVSFWMKDMRFSIDIIWVSEELAIVGIEKNLSPATFPQTFSPTEPVKYVIELNAGWADNNNIEVGDSVNLSP